jgi:uncharacterized protein DUF6494
MNPEIFSVELRQFLRKFGITTQREIEQAVETALQSGALKGSETLHARAVVHIDGLPGEITVLGDIKLG